MSRQLGRDLPEHVIFLIEYKVSGKKKDVPKHPDYREQQYRKLDQIDPGAA